MPFHVWLPKAHPEAPSPVSALMSGAMVALGVYGIVLVGDVLLGGGPVWWWLIVLTLGAVSALFGSLHAANSTDLKRLLAYSTTDNIGLALLALGASGLFAATGHGRLGALSLVAALVLLVNHAMFKGALFLLAGSVQVAAGTRDLDDLGGLLRRMPQTGALFLLAAASICALPPLNGFVGEWLLFQSLLHGVNLGSTAGDVAIPVAVAALALTAGLTVVAFVKAAGVGFLGRPRSLGADVAKEVPVSMRVGSGILVALCVVAGVAPMLLVPAVERAVRTALTGTSSAPLVRGVELQLVGVRGTLAPTVLAASMVAVVIAVAALRRALSRRRMVRVTEAWGCGRELVTARMQYTATSFAEPVQRVFDDVLRPVRDIDVSHVAESRYVIDSVTFHSQVDDRIESTLYLPVIRWVRRWGQFARRLQPGSVHRYLAYGLVALVVTLVVVAVVAMSGVLHTAGVAGVSVLQVVIVGAGGLTLLGLMRKVRARMEGRTGAPVLQPLRDVRKMMRKERLRPEFATWIFPLAPVVLVATVTVAAAMTPLVTSRPALSGGFRPLCGGLPAARRFGAARARWSGRGDGLRRNGRESGGHHRRVSRARAPCHDPRPVGLDALVEPPRRSSGPPWPNPASSSRRRGCSPWPLC